MQSWNNLRGTNIRIGQKLKVGRRSGSSASRSTSASSSSSKPASSSSQASYTTYTVKSGDTLYSIAKRYPGVTAQEIMKYNGIGEKLSVGQKIKIPKH